MMLVSLRAETIKPVFEGGGNQTVVEVNASIAGSRFFRISVAILEKIVAKNSVEYISQFHPKKCPIFRINSVRN